VADVPTFTTRIDRDVFGTDIIGTPSTCIQDRSTLIAPVSISMSLHRSASASPLRKPLLINRTHNASSRSPSIDAKNVPASL
jgi:hypothetical protein